MHVRRKKLTEVQPSDSAESMLSEKDRCNWKIPARDSVAFRGENETDRDLYRGSIKQGRVRALAIVITRRG